MSKPKQVTTTMYVHADKYSVEGYTLYCVDMTEHGSVCLGPVEVTFDVPDVDPIAKEIETLEAVKRTVVTEYETKLAHLDEKLNNLRSLTYDGATA